MHKFSIYFLFSRLILALMAGLPLLNTVQAETYRYPYEEILPRHQALEAEDLAVIINDSDPLSATLGEYYVAKRKIPRENVIHIEIKPGTEVLSVEEFRTIKDKVDQATPLKVQAYALTWVAPYRVGCMSITSAFAMGYNPAFCADGCKATQQSPYYNSTSKRPWDDHGIRPTMSIAANSLIEGVKLVRRGVKADYSYPIGTGYLVSTSDNNRNVRSANYQRIMEQLGLIFNFSKVDTNALEDKEDVFFYFTGVKKVSDLDTLYFLPGAIADHLTSAGGILTGSSQMSALKWLEAGATGSYGTVVEPCNFPQKFPHPHVVIQHYLNGDSLIEAYWKSVAWPGQGIFIGEPLARPFGIF